MVGRMSSSSGRSRANKDYPRPHSKRHRRSSPHIQKTHRQNVPCSKTVPLAFDSNPKLSKPFLLIPHPKFESTASQKPSSFLLVIPNYPADQIIHNEHPKFILPVELWKHPKVIPEHPKAIPEYPDHLKFSPELS